jgi:hypothetical protein
MKYKLTQEQFDGLIKQMQAVPMIALNCGAPRNQQENANTAWRRLGEEMGFDSMTVQPFGSNPLDFTATPLPCKGIELGDGNYSGCKGGSDCPVCEGSAE